MSVILRTDLHATRQEMYDAHPDYIAVTADGQKRRHCTKNFKILLHGKTADLLNEILEKVIRRKGVSENNEQYNAGNGAV